MNLYVLKFMQCHIETLFFQCGIIESFVYSLQVSFVFCVIKPCD